MKKINADAILVLIISTTFLSSLLYCSSQNWSQAKSTSSINNKSVNGATKTIELTTKEVKDGIYNWINASNGVSNPTIKAFIDTKNLIKIQNPKDTKHELIIDTGADVLPSSDDIKPNSSGQLVFNPPATGTFTYCAYHPFTMKGTIKVENLK